MTKEERLEYSRNYYAENRERLNANARYRFHHREDVRMKNREKARKWYQDHKNDPAVKARYQASNKKYRMKLKEKEDERKIG